MLKDTQIKALKARDKSYTVADGDGLSIVVNPNGSKKWRYRYRIGGKAKTFSLGSYPEVSLSSAREKLREARAMVADGSDPSKARKEKKVVKAAEAVKKITFKEVKDAYLLSIRPNVSTPHYDRSESLLRLYAEPVFNTMPIEDITHKDVKAIVMSLVDMDKKPSAKKLFETIKQVFDHAEARDNVEVNVCNLINITSLAKGHTAVKSPTMTKPEDIKLLLDSIWSLCQQKSFTVHGIDFSTFFQHTSCTMEPDRFQRQYNDHTKRRNEKQRRVCFTIGNTDNEIA